MVSRQQTCTKNCMHNCLHDGPLPAYGELRNCAQRRRTRCLHRYKCRYEKENCQSRIEIWHQDVLYRLRSLLRWHLLGTFQGWSRSFVAFHVEMVISYQVGLWVAVAGYHCLWFLVSTWPSRSRPARYPLRHLVAWLPANFRFNGSYMGTRYGPSPQLLRSHLLATIVQACHGKNYGS